MGQQILISGLDDINFGSVAPTGGKLLADIRICIAVDQPTFYQVTAMGDDSGGDFNLRSGPYRMAYRVRYTDRKRQRGFRRLFPGQPLTGLRTRGNNNATCQKLNAGVRVELPAASMRSAPSGNYQSTLTLMVSPE